MSVLPRTLAWQRTDVTGGEFTVFDDRTGLVARGSAFAAMPVPYACRYDLTTDAAWASTGLEVSAHGAGWQRTLHMERTADGWRITTEEQGNLNAAAPTAPLPGIEDPDRLLDAFDIDLHASPLTNTLPMRRLGLLGQPAGTTLTITAAWVLLPSLAVIPSEQTYTVLGERKIQYSSETFAADLTVDDDGFVVNYPALATR